ncbi:glycosyltransferase [Pontibacter diazotrophicus]|uniref:Glycosyltransferase n=1 Tax=Pontibacter diazotrophicus TaxID=1400979 RepID=A0A3D8LH68_9BACT|nr:glycosyltransferase family 2 protein [Pontibacter diazotrophicus]RDV16686.1 glycosyltransferase [Pontibacter diazotrophicus]
MLAIEIFLQSVLYIIGAFLLFNCAYLLFFSIAGHKNIKRLPIPASKQFYRKICILIPAYREDNVILETSQAALNQPYNGEFDVVVIADGLKSSTIQTLKQQGAKVIEVNFERSTKGKALAWALDALPKDEYDIAAVLDVDNLMGTNFLEEINKAFAAGYKVVQAHRTAKNMDSAFALLDTCNEEINNHLFRKGQFAVGLSSCLIGSGMAFQFSYLIKLLVGIGETVGEDKEIDMRIAKDQVKICYLDKVYVYDEKIENAKVFTQQRTRWIAAQVDLLKEHAGEGVLQLFKHGNIEFFNKILQTIIMPRTLLAGVLGVFFLLSFFIPYAPAPHFWGGLLVAYIAAMFLALPGRLYNRNLFAAMLRLPYALFCMCAALLKMNKTKSSFLPTPHKAKAVSSDVNN